MVILLAILAGLLLAFAAGLVVGVAVAVRGQLLDAGLDRIRKELLEDVAEEAELNRLFDEDPHGEA